MGNQICCSKQQTNQPQLPQIIKQQIQSNQTGKGNLRSTIKSVPIKMNNIEIKEQFKKLRTFKIQQSISFKVVEMTMSEELMVSFKNLALKELQFYRSQTESKWSLHEGGFYMHRLKPKGLAILNSHCYFQGDLKESNDKKGYFTDDRVVYIDKDGKYEGKMKNMKADGPNGKLQKWRTKITYQGFWIGGKLKKGKIFSQKFSFEGNFDENGLAEQGQLRFIDKGQIYSGKFRNGLYYTNPKGYEIAIYDTPRYSYKGKFLDGMKHGDGKLNFFGNYDDKGKHKEIKYMSPQFYEGIWYKDGHVESAILIQKLFMEQIKLCILLQLGKVKQQKSQIIYRKKTINEVLQSTENNNQIKVVPLTIEAIKNFQSMQPQDQFIYYQPQVKPKKKKKQKNKGKNVKDAEFDQAND